MPDHTFNPGKTYLNPVYPHSFPDPYVLKFCGEYYAYCTGFWHDGLVFGILHSRDLVNWKEIGGAMQPLKNDAPFYWAPEVSYDNGKFYLYYSVGNETLMELRVAVSVRPDGGFIDSGRRLTTEDFAIDAHVFTDDDGARYMFYATDFLEHTYIGTGTVVDRMVDWLTLEGNPRPVTRAKYDWQVYDPQRKEKGGVRWHTVEGPFVLKRKGLYYEMFSGGNWQNISYGVSFAVADDIHREQEWEQFSDGKKVLPILRTIPEVVVGPGHNSVIRGPNNRELYCVYHSWTDNGRVLAIDRMDFAGERMFIDGATHTEQLAPFEPSITFMDDRSDWSSVTGWTISDNKAVSQSSGESEMVSRRLLGDFLCEVSFYAEASDDAGSFGFYLSCPQGKSLELIFAPENQTVLSVFNDEKLHQRALNLPDKFDLSAVHLLRIEAWEGAVKLSVDDSAITFEEIPQNPPTQIAFTANNLKAELAGLAITEGFEDLFDHPTTGVKKTGWREISGKGAFEIKDRQLILSGAGAEDAVLVKGGLNDNYEFVANARLLNGNSENSDFGFVILDEKEPALRLLVINEDDNYYILNENNSQKFPFPTAFNPKNYHQFRIIKTGEKLVLRIEDQSLGEISVAPRPTQVAVFCRRSTIAIDMVRLTVF